MESNSNSYWSDTFVSRDRMGITRGRMMGGSSLMDIIRLSLFGLHCGPRNRCDWLWCHYEKENPDSCYGGTARRT